MKREDLEFALKLAQPCIMLTEYTPVLVHYCFDDDKLFAYDCVSAITVRFATGLKCALHGDTLLKLVALASDEVTLTQKEKAVLFKSGSAKAELPFLTQKEFMWEPGEHKMPDDTIQFDFDDDLYLGWQLCAQGIAKEAKHQEWTAMVLRTGSHPALAAFDGAATVRFAPEYAIGEEARTVLVPKAVVDQVMSIRALLDCKADQIHCHLAEDRLIVNFDSDRCHVTLVGKLLADEAFDFDDTFKTAKAGKNRLPIPQGFGNAVARVTAVRNKELEQSCSLSGSEEGLLVHGEGVLGVAQTAFKKREWPEVEITCDPDRLTRYLGNVDEMMISEDGVLMYNKEQLTYFVQSKEEA